MMMQQQMMMRPPGMMMGMGSGMLGMQGYFDPMGQAAAPQVFYDPATGAMYTQGPDQMMFPAGPSTMP